MKYANRRAALKKAKEPHIALLRKFNKASTLAKTGIVAGLVLPKAIFLGVGYAGAKSAAKKEHKTTYLKPGGKYEYKITSYKNEPKKYMKG